MMNKIGIDFKNSIWRAKFNLGRQGRKSSVAESSVNKPFTLSNYVDTVGK